MSRPRATPLRSKLTWLAMSCSLVALVVSCLALGSYEWFFYRRLARSQLETLSIVTARNASAALAFDNADDAQRILQSLETEESISGARLYDEAGQSFVSYVRNGYAGALPEVAPADGFQPRGNELEMVVPVAESKRFGTLLVRADPQAFRDRLMVYMIVLLGTSTVSGLIAYLLAARLKKRITEPVQALVSAAATVQDSSDYGVRVAKRENDELGRLTDAFNAMLQRIEDHQAKLKRSEERLQLALEAAKMGMWDWDLAADAVQWNERNRELFEIPPGKPITSGVFFDRIHPEDRERVRATISAAAGALEHFSIEFRLVTPSAALRHVIARGLFVSDGSRRATRAVGVTIDVTERRRVEMRVAESEQRFRSMAERAPALIWSCDAQLKRDYFNRTWLGFTGRSLEAELGDGWREVLPPEDLERWRKVVEPAAAQADPYSLEYRIRRADGSLRWVMESGSPRFDASGVFAGYLGTCTDVTARVANEAELEEHVRVRTQQLETANRELESFSYSVSHDLRSPVRVIQGFGEIALEEVEAARLEPAVEPLRRLLRATRRMDELINAFITLARITRTELNLQAIDLSQMAEEIIAAYRAVEPQRDVQVCIARDLRCRGDERLMRIALENLLSNAWKFTAGKTGAWIELAQMNGEGRPAYYVRDNGAGFNTAFSDKLFQVFQRLHSPSQFEGLGVGLSTVARVVRRHGGEVWAEGREGEGATFYFTLPSGSASGSTPPT